MSLRRMYVCSTFAVVLASASACGSNSTNNVNAGGDAGVGGSTATGGSTAKNSQGGGGAGTGGSTGNNSQGGSTQLPGNDAGQSLSFVPSNVPDVQPSATLVAANITGTCTVDTTAGTIGCLDSTQYAAKAIQQNDVDNTDSMVFTFNSLTIGSAAQVTVIGNRPAILVAQGAISVAGMLEATPGQYSRNVSNGGGFSAPSGGDIKGGGPGAGGAPLLATHAGAGGGAYCGKGGNTNGGVAYGTPEIKPLLGGSSGGDAFQPGGAGGGAIQLISGLSVTIATTGVVHVGGSGCIWGGNGGGAGGAILLEAPTVEVRGTLAANGGAGSANSGSGNDSASASPDATPAPGGTTTPATNSAGIQVNWGGAGSAAASVDGTAGQYTLNPGGGLEDFGGGGGGGAGRIRINTTSGAASIATTATLSPAASTTCVSQGKLTAR